MSAFNVVRFRVKPDREAEFIEAHRAIDASFPGLQRAALVKIGDHAFCFVGEWASFSDIVNARPQMVGTLDRFRDCLEELGAGGVTDPVSGETVMEIVPRKGAVRRSGKPAKKRAAKRSAKKAAKPARKKAAKKPARKAAKRRR